jgi:hypothetical protein
MTRLPEVFDESLTHVQSHSPDRPDSQRGRLVAINTGPDRRLKAIVGIVVASSQSQEVTFKWDRTGRRYKRRMETTWWRIKQDFRT